MFEDDLPTKANTDAIIPGEDLSEFSIEALEERKAALTGEIARIETMINSKQSGRAAAESFFKKG
ncbi:DUF1192 domain-containing protein [Hyphobacterium sp. HN65]|uniref:DUF1192 domain-containing protein n=1 Tax=Hyphobacterium lacteum TaxID=3116575 RepID=A0ABU7LNV1_9PROT|nr:DUF1192 domain-containing protein [Hyphobacterium sp. HN65]MEE2525603.1 DUF1192 domain-containing protein [Hyphobacterium sp. HN65]